MEAVYSKIKDMLKAYYPVLYLTSYEYDRTKQKIEGIFRANEKGFGFVEVENLEQDLFVPAKNVNGALNGDTVRVSIIKPKEGNRKAEAKIIKIVKSGGGEVFENEGYINFCGVRNNATNDTFNDELYIYWKDATDGKFKCVKTSGFTTKPGKKAVLNTNGKVNSKGVAIVKEGWYPDVWHHGMHRGKYRALRQDAGVTKPIAITRDKTQYGKGGNTYE